MHEISNNMVCATSKASDQPAHTRSLIRAFASHLNIIGVLSYCLYRLVWVYTCQNTTLLEITCLGSYIKAMWCICFVRMTHLTPIVFVFSFSGDVFTLWPSTAPINGKHPKLLNDLDIASDGTIYMTDSSTKWDRRNNRYCILEAESSGR